MIKPIQYLLLIGGLLLAVSCATQPTPEAYDPPGFFSGLWNGFTICFALIGHLFDNSIRIYAFPNSGGWYDFGFFLGVSAFGGGAASVPSSSSGSFESESADALELHEEQMSDPNRDRAIAYCNACGKLNWADNTTCYYCHVPMPNARPS